MASRPLRTNVRQDRMRGNVSTAPNLSLSSPRARLADGTVLRLFSAEAAGRMLRRLVSGMAPTARTAASGHRGQALLEEVRPVRSRAQDLQHKQLPTPRGLKLPKRKSSKTKTTSLRRCVRNLRRSRLPPRAARTYPPLLRVLGLPPMPLTPQPTRATLQPPSTLTTKPSKKPSKSQAPSSRPSTRATLTAPPSSKSSPPKRPNSPKTKHKSFCLKPPANSSSQPKPTKRRPRTKQPKPRRGSMQQSLPMTSRPLNATLPPPTSKGNKSGKQNATRGTTMPCEATWLPPLSPPRSQPRGLFQAISKRSQL